MQYNWAVSVLSAIDRHQSVSLENMRKSFRSWVKLVTSLRRSHLGSSFFFYLNKSNLKCFTEIQANTLLWIVTLPWNPFFQRVYRINIPTDKWLGSSMDTLPISIYVNICLMKHWWWVKVYTKTFTWTLMNF